MKSICSTFLYCGLLHFASGDFTFESADKIKVLCAIYYAAQNATWF